MEVIVNIMHQQFYHRGNNPEYPLKRMLGGPQMCSVRFAEDPLALPRIKPPIFQPIASSLY